ncbi:CTP synthase [Bifidobacterium sp. 82T10]|uniref:CTP synthase n=1 Tax=Bifidobacterium miconis TaxID=2834435 RepID=A0ABS6WH01_9BIFI|nr:CTP synthase [Bifidobacterium miconis]
MSCQYPGRIFAGISAAAILRLEYPWALHDGGHVVLASSHSSRAQRTYRKIRRIHMADIPVREVRYMRTSGGGIGLVVTRPGETVRGECLDLVRITSPARTLVDCGLQYPFASVLAMYDSALRRGLVVREEIIAVCDGLSVDCGPVFRLLHYANPLSENGGESRCRAVIIEAGFVVPDLQQVFVDPHHTGNLYRVDFAWRLHDGRIVVLEYDGMAKYVDPSMTKGRDVRGVVHAERMREAVLQRAGVTTVLRTNASEVRRRDPLIRQLEDAGVPRARAHCWLGG